MNEPYRMILVDDEDEERGRISSKISERSGFTVVAAAGNGYDALELIEKHQPHIVLTDIKMPFVDGIELASLIRQDFPTVRVAFITGFDEFEYARKAVELQASGYLMKPVTQEDISSFLDRLRTELDAEFRARCDLDLLKDRYEKSLPLVLDDAFAALLTGSRPVSEEEIAELSSSGLSWDGASYALAVLGLLDPSEAARDPLASERLKLPLRSVTEDTLSRHGLARHSAALNSTVVFAVRDPGANFMKKLDNALYESVNTAERYLGATVAFGVSAPFSDPEALAKALQEANRALSLAFRRDAGRIVYASELRSPAPSLPILSAENARILEQAARNGTDGDLEEAVALVRRSLPPHPADLGLFAVTLCSSVARVAESFDADPAGVLGPEALSRGLTPKNADAACEWALFALKSLRAAAADRRVSGGERIVERFRSLVADRYAEADLSLDAVCDELAVSASYISLLLKRHLSTTFTAYLTGVRVEKAKELLRFSDLLVLEIAEKCGYRDVYYFSHIFKKATGESPKKYRETLSS